MSDDTDQAVLVRARELVAAVIWQLTESRIGDEALAEFHPPRRRLGLFRQEARMVPVGRVWRLGVLLLGADGRLAAATRSTRAIAPGYPGHHSLSLEQRKRFRAAAVQAGYAEGETVHFDAEPVELDAAVLRSTRGPLLLRDGALLVRWSPAVDDADAQPFEAYLSERLDLLLHPPEGA